MYLEQPLLPDITLTAEPYEFPSFVIGTKYIFSLQHTNAKLQGKHIIVLM